jgi:hypothetical protein
MIYDAPLLPSRTAAHKHFADAECISVDMAARFSPKFCMTVEEFVANVMGAKRRKSSSMRI